VTSERKAHLRELLMENRKNVLRSSADAAVQENRVESGYITLLSGLAVCARGARRGRRR
jgi:hypothetical protein